MSVRSERLKPTVRKSTLYIRNIPRDVKDAFKSSCAARGLNMTHEIVALMMAYIKTKAG